MKRNNRSFHTVTPTISISNANLALEFYEKALDAKILDINYNENNSFIMHSEIQIGDSIIFIHDSQAFQKVDERLGCVVDTSENQMSNVGFYLYVENADSSFDKAVSCGMKVLMPIMDSFWEDRFGSVIDHYGLRWSFATPLKKKRKLSSKEFT